MHRVQRVGVGQLAKIMGVLYLAVGVVIGVCFYLFSSMMPSSSMTPGLHMGGVAALIVIPVLYGLLGFLGGAFMAWLYNLVAGWVGGMEFGVEPVNPQ